ncbi:Sensor histidine kinase/response regulator [hydrothermal vent metagenome]|uniref:Sensor histidine kinase/response regulator n=1 Tax=hydrothermal vent metagenome TaxID=652676 RepID=A0A3B1AID0_9ZZZZ
MKVLYIIFFSSVLSFNLLSCNNATNNPVVEQGKTEKIPTTLVNTEQLPKVLNVFQVGENVYVRSLKIENSSNTLWVGTSLGVHEIDLKTQNIRNTFTRDHGLANEYVFAIGIDADGYKWFGTNAGGMSRYKDGNWKTYFPMHGLADYWIYSFTNDQDGGLWIGTWAGANYLNRKTGEFKTYVKELINEWVYGLATDHKGNIWFGTEGGVSRFDGKQWQSWNNTDGLGGKNSDALAFSRNTGLGTRSRHDLGIMANGKATYNPNYVFCIMADQQDTIWAGTWGGGVAQFKNGKWTNLMKKDGLAGNIVYSMAQDKNGIYWFGTNRGLSRFDGKNWNTWNVHDGLAGNDIYAIAINGNELWLGSRSGVSRLGFN